MLWSRDASRSTAGRAPEQRIRWPHAVSLIAVADSGAERRWAARAAQALIRKLERQQNNVVLVDLGGPDSILSKILGVKRDEGVADVLIRGLPFSTIGKRPKTHSFLFLPASSLEPPPPSLCGFHEWEGIAARFGDAGSYVVLFIPERLWVEEGPTPGFTDAIILQAAARETDLPGVHVIARLRRRPVSDVADSREEEREADKAARADVQHVSIEIGSRLRFKRRATVRGPRSGSHLLRTAALAPAVSMAWLLLNPAERTRIWDAVKPLVGELVAMLQREDGAQRGVAHAGATGRLGGAPPDAAGAAIPQEKRDPPDVAGPVQDQPLPYSVQIAAYDDLGIALGKQREFVTPDWGSYVVPLPPTAPARFRLLAGPFATEKQAERARADIASRGPDTAGAFLTSARFAYVFQTHADEKAADNAVESLRRHRIPAYWIRASNGYRVYAGGYGERQHAEALGSRIARAGLTADLEPLAGVTARNEGPGRPPGRME